MPAFGDYGKHNNPAPNGNPTTWNRYIKILHRPTGDSVWSLPHAILDTANVRGWDMAQCTLLPVTCD